MLVIRSKAAEKQQLCASGLHFSWKIPVKVDPNQMNSAEVIETAVEGSERLCCTERGRLLTAEPNLGMNRPSVGTDTQQSVVSSVSHAV